jgi:cytochrome bd-type quinol oxidase subunit 2
MGYTASMRYVVVLMLILIVGSLVSGLFFVMRDDHNSKRAVKALALRVGLSVALFLVLMGSYYFGFIPGRVGG